MAEVEESPRTEASIEEQEDFSALLRALRRARGFALYFVECNVPVYRRTVADALRARLDREVVDVDLSDVDRSEDRPSIDYVLERRLADAPEDAAVFVWGLDGLLPSTTGDEAITRHTLNEVNWRRGTWAQLDRPLVVWLPEYAIRFLARNAPDFFDWNSGLYVFETPEPDRSSLLEASLDSLKGKRPSENLTTEEKRRREAYLKSLLEEYSGDADFDLHAQADILLRLAELHLGCANYDRARSYARRAHDVSRTVENREAEARACHDLAVIALEQGEYEEAREGFGEALETHQEIGDLIGETATRHELARVALRQGDYGGAREEFEGALETYQEIGDRTKEATTRHQLATIALRQGDYEEARRELEKSLRIDQDIGNQRGEASTRHNLATIALEQGDYEKARREFEEALEIRREIGDRSGEATTRHNLATIALEQGDYEKARREFEEALEIRREIGDRSGEAATRHQLATIALNQREYEEAQKEFEEALGIRREIGDRSGEASTRHQLATVTMNQEEYEKARTGFEKALRIRQEIGDRSGEAMTLAQLGILAAGGLGQQEEGLRILHVSYNILKSIEHAKAEQVELLIQGLGYKLGYDEQKLKEERELALRSYAEDRGWSLIQEAFPDADVPDDVPPTE